MDWDKKLASLGGHFLQSKAWLDFQESLSQKTIRVLENDYIWGGYVVDGRLGVRYLYLPYGPVFKDEKAFEKAIDSICRESLKHGCIFARFDLPKNLSQKVLDKAGAKYFGEVQPEHTHIIDLKEDLTLMKSRMSKTNRNLINRSEKIVKYSTSEDIAKFLDLMLSTAEYKHYQAKSRGYLQKQLESLLKSGVAKIYVGEYEGSVVAGAVGADWNGTRYYLHAGGDQTVIRKLPIARGLAWYMIKDAKEKGLKEFDFYGVSEFGAVNHKWASVSSFKRSFSGQDKDFGGTWDVPVSKVKYSIYKTLKKITG